MRIQTDVEIDIVTSDDYIGQDGGGGLLIRINGERLNKCLREPDYKIGHKGQYGWYGYDGDDIVADLTNIIDTTIDICDAQLVYVPQKVHFAGYNNYLSLEHLGEGVIRLAYRIEPDAFENDYSEAAIPIPSNACGHPVESEVWLKALRDAATRLQGKLRDTGEDANADWFAEKCERIDSLVE